MARLVLVEFDSDAAADAFIQKIDSQTEKGKKFRIVGLFAKPTRWCGCPQDDGYSKNEVVMGGKYGWWVHIKCRRPRMGTHNPHNLIKPRLNEETGITTIVTTVGLAEVPTQNLKNRWELDERSAQG